jgi:GntR family transcriptional regulator/MocR family aminotransferase
VWVEDPDYPPTQQVLRSAGQRAVSVPVDEEGMVVAQGMRKAAKAKMAVVTPSHQAPLGVSMSLARRLQLLDWASQAKVRIVEDEPTSAPPCTRSSLQQSCGPLWTKGSEVRV